jgi:hypothetical protein
MVVMTGAAEDVGSGIPAHAKEVVDISQASFITLDSDHWRRLYARSWGGDGEIRELV